MEQTYTQDPQGAATEEAALPGGVPAAAAYGCRPRESGSRWTALIVIAVVAVVLTLLLSLFAGKPKLVAPPRNPSQPTATVQVDSGRDFGYRIGDPIDVTVSITVPPNAVLDPNGFSASGDFEHKLRQPPTETSLGGGYKLVRLHLTLQSFVPKQKLTMNALVPYRMQGQREEKELLIPPLDLYWSKTWDGRMMVQGERWDSKPISHWPETFILLVLAVVASLYSFSLLQRALHKEPPAPGCALSRANARLLFDSLVRRLRDGDHSDEVYRALIGLIRARYKMAALPLEFVPIAVGEVNEEGPVTSILAKLETALFSGRPLPAEHLGDLDNFGPRLEGYEQ